ncbi:DUF559 domain-containing protein [Pseudomonas sp. R2.Fl]|nr:DUF559 domain-containing protein [Pseudomonas sp. R2.Fl]
MRPYHRYLKPHARRLRRDMTDAEQRLWFHLRRKQLDGVQFYRQKPLGRYIVDFYGPAVDLVIELDGSQHFTADGLVRDRRRDAFLAGQGLRVLRFDDRQALLETAAVLEVILRVIRER